MAQAPTLSPPPDADELLPRPDRRAAFTRHLRRYLPFYVLAGLWALMMAILPTTKSENVATSGRFGNDAGSAEGGFTDASQAAGAGPAGAAAQGTAAAQAAAKQAQDRAAAGAQQGVGATPGVTRGGFPCKPGLRQLPTSAYSGPCKDKWVGNNGGVTWRGVDASTIKIVSRTYTLSPSRAAVDAVSKQAGRASSQDQQKMRTAFVDYFNKVFELYGRKVVVENFTSNANELEEVQNRGRETACADATAVAQEKKAFATIPGPLNLGYGPYSECAVEQGLVVPIGPYGFPESWYRKRHPFAWGGQMDCDRITYLMSEYVGKRLKTQPARWARDAGYKALPRKYGLLEPDVNEYKSCSDLEARVLKSRYGIDLASRFAYNVDPSRMSAQATQAVVQFKAAGVTTLILGSDFLMNINVTRQAGSQNWGPEWLIIGAGGQDDELYTRLYDQNTISGHLFGMSELGPTAGYYGGQSEPVTTYKKVTGQDPPANAEGDYFPLMRIYNALQAAGPNLTPETFAAGMAATAPMGAPRFDDGLWSFRTNSDGAPGLDHTAVDDAREVYWDGGAPGFDGKPGGYTQTYGGRRFTNGQWPAETPPIYPGR